MKKSLFLAIGVLIVAVIVVLAILWSNSMKMSDVINSSSDEMRSLKIGVSVCLTGPAAFIGTSYLEGLKLAQEEINNNGGIAGRRIELIIEDNQNLAKEGVTVFKALEVKDPDIIISTMSTAAVAMSPLAKEAGIPLFVSMVFADVLSTNENAVSFFPTAKDDAKASVRDMKLGRIKTLGVLYLNNQYGKASFEAIEEEAKKEGIKIISEEFAGEGDDFKTPLLKLLDKKPDAIYLAAMNSIPVINYLKLKDSNILIYTNLVPVFGNLVYKETETFEGVHLTAPQVSIPGTEAYLAFRNLLQNRTDTKNNTLGYTSIGYDNLYAIASVLDKNKDPKLFVQGFSNYGELEGINGNFTLNRREVGFDLYPVVFKNGTLVLVD